MERSPGVPISQTHYISLILALIFLVVFLHEYPEAAVL
jgi:hypothetical protein